MCISKSAIGEKGTG